MLLYAPTVNREPVLPTEANLNENIQLTDTMKIRDRALAVRNEAVQNIKNKQIIDKQRYDGKHRHVIFKPGDKVKVFTPNRKVGKSEKLLLKYHGPFYIIKKISDVDYEVQKGPTARPAKEIIHVSRILPYNDPWTPPILN